MKTFPDITMTMNKWLMDKQVLITLTPIQEEKAQKFAGCYIQLNDPTARI